MKQEISLTVNGVDHTLSVTSRTQLAEILRNELDLTGTHLGCEQGVCGACTVLIDGKPARSCITFAGSCHGINVETIEGFQNDDVMDRLRDAFSRHHALQCGFCTPGMLATARDIVERFTSPDTEKIRYELSGNLCRCTGYVGIVAAISDVIEQQIALGGLPSSPTVDVPEPASGFVPFEPSIATRVKQGNVSLQKSGKVSAEGNRTVVERSFSIDHEPEVVWQHFRDLKSLVTCVPGAVIDNVDDNRFEGHVEVRFGPIKANFRGSGTYTNNDVNKSGSVIGKGADKGGQSNLEGQLNYIIRNGETSDSSIIDVDFKFEIQGMLAQFNRPELVTGFVDFILDQFVQNCNSVLSGEEVKSGRRISAFGLVGAVIRSKLATWFRSN